MGFYTFSELHLTGNEVRAEVCSMREVQQRRTHASRVHYDLVAAGIRWSLPSQGQIDSG